MRINLKKYGFIESPTENFYDDGTRFTIYRNEFYPDLRVSKAIVLGDVYLAARIEPKEYRRSTLGLGKLDYDEYSSLPHYKNCDDLNGIAQSYITEDILASWIMDIEAYYNEYQAKLKELALNNN